MVVAMAAGAAVDMLAVAALPAIRRPGGKLQPAAAKPVAGAAGGKALAGDLRLVAALALAVAVPALIFNRNYHAVDSRDSWAVHNYAVDALSQPLDNGASVVGILGEMTLLDYFQETKAMRPIYRRLLPMPTPSAGPRWTR